MAPPVQPAISNSRNIPDKFVGETLDALRRKLLDLTTRNPLLSFKHGSRARKYVRVIDELPDQLFERLEDDQALRFRSVGAKREEPEDERTVTFRRTLDAAKLGDPEYIEKLQALGDDPGERALERLEQELRATIRDRLGMPSRRPTTGLTPAEAARHQGLDPSFDLPTGPTNGGGRADKHVDSAVQTLLFGDDLDRMLAKIRDAVRLSIDESGVNPLFSVFGFLEWYEDGNSEVPLHAPLLLYPLELERELVRGQWQYNVRSTGEPASSNAALAERLKRDFDLVLPDIDKDDTPEEYLAKIQKVIERQKSWKIRRWVTAGLFSFARIAMYHDLKPESWKAKGGLERHPGLGRLLAGGEGGGSATDAASPPTFFDDSDATPEDEFRIPLVADADSSQLAAIRDVLSGRSLVIEGPPGTGKSQTITNIIAAVLAEGKTVLFLAEKMAALNVVKDRLDHAQLGDFCLELHSTRSGRKDTYSKLANRLARQRRPNVADELAATLRNLDVTRNQLGECVTALAQPAGKLGISVQELLWKCHLVRKQTESLPGEIDELLLPDADLLTEADIGRRFHVCAQFERTRTQVVRQYGSVSQHPWRGIASPNMDPFTAGDVVRRVARLADAAGEAEAVLASIRAISGWAVEYLGDLEGVAAAAAVPAPGSDAPDDLVARTADPQTRAAMVAFADDVTSLLEASNRCTASFADASAAAACQPEWLRRLGQAATVAGLADVPVGDLPAWSEKRSREAEAWIGVSQLLNQVAARANWTEPLTPPSERLLVAAVELAASANPVVLSGRSTETSRAGASVILERGAERSLSLRQRRTAYGSQYSIDAPFEPQTLRRHAAAVRGAPILPFLNLDWWRAKAVFKGLCRQPVSADRGTMAAAMDELAALREDLTGFALDSELAKCVGSAFRGVDSDLERPLAAAKWADRVRARIPAVDDASIRLQTLLLHGQPDQIESLASLVTTPRWADLQKALKVESSQIRTLSQQVELNRTKADAASAAAKLANDIRLVATSRASVCEGLAADLDRMVALREALDHARTVETVLGARFNGHKTDVSPVRAAIRFADAVDKAALPVPLRGWLLSGSAAQRVRQLLPLADQASLARTKMLSAIDDIASVAAVDWQAWVGAPSPVGVAVADLRAHGVRCAQDADGLQLLIDDARLLQDVYAERLGPLIEVLERHRTPLATLGAACQRVVYQSLARAAISRNSALATFTGERQESRRTQFRELDRKLLRLRQAKIAFDLANRPVDPGSSIGPKSEWTGLALAQNEAGKQRRHIPVRDLLSRAGPALQALTPCFMMSPLSIAQYLKPGELTFDLVIMDEASQLRPEDAIGAIARGSQIVVVGDPKQLPPTNFFMGSSSSESGEEGPETAADEQSILDVALSILRPPRRLKWHYRSRDASLIAFSNKEFYDSQLVVFPAPHHRHAEFGVRYVHVEDGKYRGSVNVPEAQRVALAAVEHTEKHPERTLGLVSLNQPQAELLSLEIDRLAAERPEFEAWRKKRETTLEPFFVKNLENVQGDERDTIFISTVYGRDEEGNLFQRFGPINNQGGHRRLNVLFTRAKCQTVVFSSMDPGEIRADDSSTWGVRALKGFLKFAKDGSLDISRETGRAPDSAFEVAVAEALRNAGFEAVTQVGVVGYFIDIAIRHPEREGEFVLGVECDGAMYHSSKSARDRDRLRQEVLERLKWRLHRIWSLDWYRNPRRETERLVTAVQRAIAAAKL